MNEEVQLEFGLLDEPEFDWGIVITTWAQAVRVSGNDPELWRKDEFGAWIYRLDYGNRRSQFGWEIYDRPSDFPSLSPCAGLRPLQWQNLVDLVSTTRGSIVTADGLQNMRKLL